MAADVDICNLALGHLGDDANIASLTENSAQAAYCNRFYPIARDMVLQRGGFSFTLRRVALATDLVTIPKSWQYAYQGVNNSLKKIAVLAPDATDDTQSVPYAVESVDAAGTEVIYTNISSATLRYIQRVTDTTKYSPLIVHAISRLLAAFLAGPLIKGQVGIQMAQSQMKIFEDMSLPQAMADDANSQQTDHFNDFVPKHMQSRVNGTVTPIWPGPLSSFP